MELKDRIEFAKKALFGIAVGDCFGQTFFSDSNTALDRIKMRQISEMPWHFTDDTVMGIGVFCTLKQYGEIIPDKLAATFGKNYLLDWHRGYGGTAHSILQAIGEGADFREVSPKVFSGMGSMGNGAAMRAAPIGAYFADDLDQVIRQAKLSAEVTHSHLEGITGAIAVALASAKMLLQKLSGDMFSPENFLNEIAQMLPESDTRSKILSSISLKKENNIEFIVSILGNGTSLTSQDTVPFSLWCAAHYKDHLEEALWKAVSALGDRDTICAIVGGIVALYNDRIPTEWEKYIEYPENTVFMNTRS